MLHTINGLPAHVLLIHAVVVLLPLGALMLAVGVVWPAARAKLGVLTPVVSLIALVLVPITTSAGEWLQDQLPNNFGHTDPQIVRHAHLGGQLLPWAIGIFVMAAAVWALDRRFHLAWTSARAGDTAGAGRAVLPRWVTGLVTLVSVAVAIGGVVQLVRIGDSGAKAVWGGAVG